MESGKLGYGVRVNCVYPGLVPTDDGHAARRRLRRARAVRSPEAAVGAVVGLTPAGRLGEVTDMADAVVFLASDAARFVNGTGLPVDGGMGMGMSAKPVVVYGASGYTGRLICEYLRELNVPFVAAGRDKDRCRVPSAASRPSNHRHAVALLVEVKRAVERLWRPPQLFSRPVVAGRAWAARRSPKGYVEGAWPATTPL